MAPPRSTQVCVDLTTSAPSFFQPLRVKVPEMLQAEIGKLAPWSVRVRLVPPQDWGAGKGGDTHSPCLEQLFSDRGK